MVLAKDFKYIFSFFLIFSFSVIGNYSEIRYNPANYLKATESVYKIILQRNFNQTYHWCRTSIDNSYLFFIFNIKNFQIYLNQIFNLRILNQSKIVFKIGIFKKKILIFYKPKISLKNFHDLYR